MSDLQDRISGLSPARRALLERLHLVRPPAERAPVPRRAHAAAPLSWEQRRLWFMHRLAPEGAAYTIPVAFRLRGALDVAALERAQEAALARRAVDALAEELILHGSQQNVANADAVVVNPTHIAVALKYDPTKSDAPIVLAGGHFFLPAHADRVRTEVVSRLANAAG